MVQIIGFVRQIAFAAIFGADRSVDLYLLVVAIAAITVFIFNFIIENGSVPILVACHDKQSPASFGTLASQLFLLSVAFGVVLCLLFLVIVPLAAPVVGAGLRPEERARLGGMAVYLVPWVLCVIPFYALSAIHKAQRSFSRFLLAEVLVTAVSLAVLLLWHPSVEATALAYGAGYAAGLLSLLPGAYVRLVSPSLANPNVRALLKPLGQLSGSTVIASLGSIADRFVQSFLPAGGIAANSYASLIVVSFSTLLGFRDIFLVPFSEPNDRALKLERALIGLCLLAIPAGIYMMAEAYSIVPLLLERGRFDQQASAQTAQLLQIQALTMLAGALASPMLRMLQVLEKIHLGSAVFLTASVATLLFGSVFVLYLDWGLRGYAVATLLVSYLTMLVTAMFIVRSGLVIAWWRVLRYIGFSILAALLAAAAARASPEIDVPILALMCRTFVFGSIVAVCYGAIYPRLLWIIRQR